MADSDQQATTQADDPADEELLEEPNEFLEMVYDLEHVVKESADGGRALHEVVKQFMILAERKKVESVKYGICSQLYQNAELVLIVLDSYISHSLLEQENLTVSETVNVDANVTSVNSESQVSITANATIPEADPNSQAQAVVQAAAPTADQRYQQQNQQYYQQYPGYDPYHQQYPYQAVFQAAAPTADRLYQQQYQQYPGYDHYQQCNPYQQPGFLQPQQPLQANPPYGTVQSRPQTYMQPPLVPQPQLQTQQSQSQPQPQLQPPLMRAPPMAVQTQNQTPVNQQFQLQPAVAPHSQIQAQTYQSAHRQAQLPPQEYFPAQMTRYQQPQVQEITQTPVQQHPKLHSSQPMNGAVQSQAQLPASNASVGHQLLPQFHRHQPVLSVPPQQHTLHFQSQGVANSQLQNHSQTQIQFPVRPPLMRPPPFQTTIPNQASTPWLPSPNMISAQQPPVHSAQQPGISSLQQPLMQPVQQLNPQHYFQNQSYVPQQNPQVSHPGSAKRAKVRGTSFTS